MYYKQFLKTTNILDIEEIKKFDYFLVNLPTNRQDNITASMVSSSLNIKYNLAEELLRYGKNQGVLHEYYLVNCPECDNFLKTIEKNELAQILVEGCFCQECEEYKKISPEDIYTVYKIIVVSETCCNDLNKKEKLVKSKKAGENGNFSKADSLVDKKTKIYEAFYNPDESAYLKFNDLRKRLDLDYGKNTTAKGKALERLVLEIFNQIRYVQGTNDVKTETNQFDCTCLCHVDTVFMSIFNYLSPYFIVECKNEKKKPNNTYLNKLQSILDCNEAQLGIVFGRMDATKTCFNIEREHYLINKNSNKQQIIITCSDIDLDYLIDKRANILSYLDFKIFQVTAYSPNSTFEMFNDNDIS